jgi:glycosyltransferase involved in cell wall biosynthesis
VKLLVFAHKPPPHHGQSYMVQLLLEALTKPEPGTPPIEFYHVDSRVSTGAEDVGSMRFAKVFLILKYCFQAIFLCLRHGITHFYYVPANPSRAALYRDWIVMAFCRPFFKKLIFHWHAAGLGGWLETEAKPWERWISRRLLWNPHVSIVLAEYNRADAVKIGSRRIVVVPNGIPDPCPDFETKILPQRLARISARKGALLNHTIQSDSQGKEAHVFKVLFLSLCHRPKGLFDAVDAVVLANRKLPASIRVELTVAGAFWNEREKLEFEERLSQADVGKDGKPLIYYVGFASGEHKQQLFLESDCFCFPTYYPAESFGLVLLEAMAYGLPIVTTRWRMIPEVLPSGYPGIVSPQSPAEIAAALLEHMQKGYDNSLRAHFNSKFTLAHFGKQIETALQ